jgi:4-hydroxy-L-threonine phosphate dehydrogenase PdxA
VAGGGKATTAPRPSKSPPELQTTPDSERAATQTRTKRLFKSEKKQKENQKKTQTKTKKNHTRNAFLCGSVNRATDSRCDFLFTAEILKASFNEATLVFSSALF